MAYSNLMPPQMLVQQWRGQIGDRTARSRGTDTNLTSIEALDNYILLWQVMAPMSQ